MDNFLQSSYGDVTPVRAALANRIKRSFNQMAVVGSTFITFTFVFIPFAFTFNFTEPVTLTLTVLQEDGGPADLLWKKMRDDGGAPLDRSLSSGSLAGGSSAPTAGDLPPPPPPGRRA